MSVLLDTDKINNLDCNIKKTVDPQVRTTHIPDDLKENNLIDFNNYYTSTPSVVHKKFYNDFDNSVLIYLNTDRGIRFELFPVPLNYTASDIKFLIIMDSDLTENLFNILYNGSFLNSNTKMSDISNDKNFIELTLSLENIDSEAINFKLGLREITLVSGLTVKINGRKVKVTENPNTHEDIMVVYDDNTQSNNYVGKINWLLPNYRKPYFGGFRNTQNNKIFYNASAQTIKKSNNKSKNTLYSRSTQTYKMRNVGQITSNNMSTQFSKPGFYVSNYLNKLKTAGKYETADEYLARTLKMVNVKFLKIGLIIITNKDNLVKFKTIY